jgi:16S rRNA (guanine527-N7)-methyltransferase
MLAELEDRAAELGVQIAPVVLLQFQTLLDLLIAANANFNLTALRDPGSIVRQHFGESITLGSALRDRGLLEDEPAILDLGSGAGFPGLPIKLVWPNVRIQLLEATGKKAEFIGSAVKALELPDATVLSGRAETLAHRPDLREQLDIVVSRAVAALPALTELALPFLRMGGVLAAIKGSSAQDEIDDSQAAIEACGGELDEYAPGLIAPSTGCVFIRKIRRSPEKYPRRPGQPASHPIGKRP